MSSGTPTKTTADQALNEAIEKCARFLESEDQAEFRLACDADTQKFHAAIGTFFSTWSTSLMGAQIQMLDDISTHAEIAGHIKALYVEDDCGRLDPWNSSKPKQKPQIWPRDRNGNILHETLGIITLRRLLEDRKIRPSTIKIRDYRVALRNLGFLPEITGSLITCKSTSKRRDPSSAAALARDIIDGLHLPVLSIQMHSVKIPSCDDPLLDEQEVRLKQVPVAFEGPEVSEVVINLSWTQRGQYSVFTSLQSAKLEVAPYWLEQILYHAPDIQDLELSIATPWDTREFLAVHCRTQCLKNLTVSHTELAADVLIDLLINWTPNLEFFSLREITLTNGISWRDLLLQIQRHASKLNGFTLEYLRKGTKSSAPINFIYFTKANVAEEWRSGLKICERGPSNQRRANKIRYDGPNAGAVLESIVSYMV